MYSNDLLAIIFQTAQQMAVHMNFPTPQGDVEVREKDYNKLKEYMRNSLKYNDDRAIRYRNAMERLFSKMKIEHDIFFGNIYIASFNDFNDALAVLVDLEMSQWN